MKKCFSVAFVALMFIGFFGAIPVAHSGTGTSGWDFECHTYTHPDLTQMNNSQIEIELQRENAAFLSNGLPLPQHTTYPNGDLNGAVISVVSQYRISGRTAGWNNGQATYPVTNWYTVPSACISADKNFTNIQALIDTAIASQMLLCLFTHQVTNPAPQYGCTPEMLAQILDYLVAMQNAGQLSVMTMRDAYTSYSGQKAIVVLSFDDCYATDYTTVWPLFKTRGLSGTSYIVGELMGAPGRLTWAMVLEMAQMQPPSTEWMVNIASNPLIGGTTTPSGLQKVAPGTSLTVSASPSTNYNFTNWLFDGTTLTDNPLTLPAQADGTNHTLIAVFSSQITPPIFQSSFETGNFVNEGWNSIGTDPNDTIVTSTIDSHHGTYCALANLTGGATESAYVRKTIGGQNALYCVGYFKLLQNLPPAAKYCAVMKFAGAGTICYVYFESLQDNTLLITLAYRNGTNWEYRSYPYAYSLGVWYSIEMYAQIDPVAGAYAVWLNYNPILSVTNKNSANYGSITDVSVGVTSGDTGIAHQVEADCFAIANSFITSDPFG